MVYEVMNSSIFDGKATRMTLSFKLNSQEEELQEASSLGLGIAGYLLPSNLYTKIGLHEPGVFHPTSRRDDA